MRKTTRRLTAVLALASTFALARTAQADDTIKRPGDHPHYSVELEPHVLLGWAAQWVGTGFGLGGRVSIPVTHDGFIKTINNSVAISFGLDWVHYSGVNCYYYDPHYGPNYCYGYGSTDFIQIPVVMQWNFYVAQKWSVFGEPGLYIWHGFYGSPNYPCGGPGLPNCGLYNYGYYNGNDTGVGPAFYAGGRFHFSDSASLTMRIGYPDLLTFGVSFFL